MLGKPSSAVRRAGQNWEQDAPGAETTIGVDVTPMDAIADEDGQATVLASWCCSHIVCSWSVSRMGASGFGTTPIAPTPV